MTYEYPLGRHHAPDPHDHQYLMAAVLEEQPPPPIRSISYQRGPILDQRPRPSCVGHGWRAELNGAPIRQRGGPSALEIYIAAQKVDEWPGEDYDGTSVRAGAKVLQALGYISSYIWAFDEPTIRQWLLSGRGGVVIGVNWYSEMFRPDHKGFLNVGGTLAGGHCVWLRRYDHHHDAYKLQNSWGEAWGLRGQAWIRGTDLAMLIAEDGEACCGIEVRG